MDKVKLITMSSDDDQKTSNELFIKILPFCCGKTKKQITDAFKKIIDYLECSAIVQLDLQD